MHFTLEMIGLDEDGINYNWILELELIEFEYSSDYVH